MVSWVCADRVYWGFAFPVLVEIRPFVRCRGLRDGFLKGIVMLQCRDCEFFVSGPDGEWMLACDPFATVKEPECIAKWQLIQLQRMAKSHAATLEHYERLAPMQEKMFRHVERELDEMDDADSWKADEDEEEDGDENEDEDGGLR